MTTDPGAIGDYVRHRVAVILRIDRADDSPVGGSSANVNSGWLSCSPGVGWIVFMNRRGDGPEPSAGLGVRIDRNGRAGLAIPGPFPWHTSGR